MLLTPQNKTSIIMLCIWFAITSWPDLYLIYSLFMFFKIILKQSVIIFSVIWYRKNIIISNLYACHNCRLCLFVFACVLKTLPWFCIRGLKSFKHKENWQNFCVWLDAWPLYFGFALFINGLPSKFEVLCAGASCWPSGSVSVWLRPARGLSSTHHSAQQTQLSAHLIQKLLNLCLFVWALNYLKLYTVRVCTCVYILSSYKYPML